MYATVSPTNGAINLFDATSVATATRSRRAACSDRSRREPAQPHARLRSFARPRLRPLLLHARTVHAAETEAAEDAPAWDKADHGDADRAAGSTLTVGSDLRQGWARISDTGGRVGGALGDRVPTACTFTFAPGEQIT
jgi:hypothetical protein